MGQWFHVIIHLKWLSLSADCWPKCLAHQNAFLRLPFKISRAISYSIHYQSLYAMSVIAHLRPTLIMRARNARWLTDSFPLKQLHLIDSHLQLVILLLKQGHSLNQIWRRRRISWRNDLFDKLFQVCIWICRSLKWLFLGCLIKFKTVSFWLNQRLPYLVGF